MEFYFSIENLIFPLQKLGKYFMNLFWKYKK